MKVTRAQMRCHHAHGMLITVNVQQFLANRVFCQLRISRYAVYLVFFNVFILSFKIKIMTRVVMDISVLRGVIHSDER
jgi:hypothetical protein